MTTTTISKALILCAGHGKRLAPLTNHCPKPLLPFAGVTLVDLCLYRVYKAGINDIAINTHALSEQIFKHFEQPSLLPQPLIQYEPTLRGSAGVYDGLKNWVGNSDILALNGDVLSLAPLEDVLNMYDPDANEVLMSIRQQPSRSDKQIWCDRDKIISISKNPPSTKNTKGRGFGSTQVITNTLMQYIPPDQPSEIMPIYQQLLANSSVRFRGLEQNGFWHDMGTPHDYFHAHMELATNFVETATKLGICELWRSEDRFIFCQHEQVRNNSSLGPNVLWSQSATIAKNCRIGPRVIMNGICQIGEGAVISDTVILPNARIEPHERISFMLVGDGFRVPIPH